MGPFRYVCPVSSLWTAQFQLFRPSSFCPWDRPLWFFKTVKFHPFKPSSLNLLGRLVFALGTVYFDSLRPSSFIPLDRPLLSLETVQIQYFRSYGHFPLDRPLLDFRNVLFRKTFTFSLLNRSCWFVAVQFQSLGPSSLTQDRPLWTWPKNIIWNVRDKQVVLVQGPWIHDSKFLIQNELEYYFNGYGWIRWNGVSLTENSN